jgi:protein-S-isoprenylcysteine O-methyltransferase Ste14
LGAGLVALQFASLLLLAVLAGPAAQRGDISVASAVLVVAAVALAIWILLHNRLGNFNIQPLPKASGRLVTSGPYRWVRHPMYSAVLLGAAALALLAAEAALGWGLWCGLALVLWAKSHFEEQWLQEKYPAYAAYKHSSKRFIPLLF